VSAPHYPAVRAEIRDELERLWWMLRDHSRGSLSQALLLYQKLAQDVWIQNHESDLPRSDAKTLSGRQNGRNYQQRWSALYPLPKIDRLGCGKWL